MCGRFTVKASWAELVALYRLTTDAPPHNLRPRHNVCPTDPADTVVEEDGKRDLVSMRWGLVPRWWSKPLKELRAATFNARAETVETKPFFRDAFKRTRCLIPMSGYYEWQDTPSGKQPWYFTARDGSPILTAAGLWDEWKNRETGERLKSCTMIVTEPNEFAAEIHDRMPAFLTVEQFAPWLSRQRRTSHQRCRLRTDQRPRAPDAFPQRRNEALLVHHNRNARNASGRDGSGTAHRELFPHGRRDCGSTARLGVTTELGGSVRLSVITAETAWQRLLLRVNRYRVAMST
jgi:putative SOS response-associated peptidase YedK